MDNSGAPAVERTVWVRLRQIFLTGLAITLPLIITIWLLRVLFEMVHGLSTPVLLGLIRVLSPRYAEDPAFAIYLAPLIGIVLTALLILLVGGLTTNLLGRRIVASFDRLIMRLPLVRGIYGGARQLLDAFRNKPSSFQKVVMVEYPRAGVYSVGFVTHEQVVLGTAGGASLNGRTFVFLPTVPNPTSGWLVLVRDDEIVQLDMSIEDGFKLILSGGLVTPGEQEKQA
ncbi:MAG TPA: DUF502 domain-containing protein [Candidatus Polarisedimenticolia bacterium]|nr:DUF502 domain-containing protein [Candidatus Polarisedimenticolia bacterium]